MARILSLKRISREKFTWKFGSFRIFCESKKIPKKMRLIIPLLIVFIFTSCSTNPPVDVDESFETGKLFVTSNVPGASIYVNNNNIGKVTPDTITVPVGNVTVRIEKEGYIASSKNIHVTRDSIISLDFTLLVSNATKIVLLEDFSNVSCGPCVGTNKIIESLKKYAYGSKILPIRFSTNFPSPNDPFYTANKPDCNARMVLYSIQSSPTVVVDGILFPISTDSNSIKQRIDSRLTETPKFKITASDSVCSSEYFIKIRVENIDTAGLKFPDLFIHTVVTETEIEYTTPPGSNGETKFHDVMRKMLPTSGGEVLPAMIPGGVKTFERQITISGSWNVTKLNSVVFIQNKSTKEILQAVSTNN